MIDFPLEIRTIKPMETIETRSVQMVTLGEMEFVKNHPKQLDRTQGRNNHSQHTHTQRLISC